MSRTIQQREHLHDLANRIAAMPKPLGSTMQDGCWGAVVIHTASENAQSPHEYYGLSDEELQGKITLNRETDPQSRNAVMLHETLQLIG